MSAAYKSGEMPTITIITSQTMPGTSKAERVAYSDITIDEFTLAKFEKKSKTEEEIPFKFGNFEVLETCKEARHEIQLKRHIVLIVTRYPALVGYPGAVRRISGRRLPKIPQTRNLCWRSTPAAARSLPALKCTACCAMRPGRALHTAQRCRALPVRLRLS